MIQCMEDIRLIATVVTNGRVELVDIAIRERDISAECVDLLLAKARGEVEADLKDLQADALGG